MKMKLVAISINYKYAELWGKKWPIWLPQATGKRYSEEKTKEFKPTKKKDLQSAGKFSKAKSLTYLWFVPILG